MQGDTFKVGDVVVVREWDDMAAQYGVRDELGPRINPGDDGAYCFVNGMRPLCGTEREITFADDAGDVFYINDDDVSKHHFFIEPWMIMHIDDAYSQDDIEDVSDEEFASLLQAAGA